MDENTGSVVEKRRFTRVKVGVPLQYKNLKKSLDISSGALTRNLSEGGVCFKTTEFISLACRLVVEITIPTSVKPIKAISKIAWIRKLPAGNQYELGNQFLEMAKEDKLHISNFINESLNTGI
ncbi:MAG: PilZ domain-containing protein [Candidatus Omnitrophota bacterium]|nr:PilZ domain-containing protein [Candidatus Omnitrophota bacterium]